MHFLITVSFLQGCQTIIHCATEDTAKLRNGKFYRNGMIDENIENYLDTKFSRDDSKKLFHLSEEAVGLRQSSFMMPNSDSSNQWIDLFLSQELIIFFIIFSNSELYVPSITKNNYDVWMVLKIITEYIWSDRTVFCC